MTCHGVAASPVTPGSGDRAERCWSGCRACRRCCLRRDSGVGEKKTERGHGNGIRSFAFATSIFICNQHFFHGILMARQQTNTEKRLRLFSLYNIPGAKSGAKKSWVNSFWGGGKKNDSREALWFLFFLFEYYYSQFTNAPREFFGFIES